jgi:hypothetical protein
MENQGYAYRALEGAFLVVDESLGIARDGRQLQLDDELGAAVDVLGRVVLRFGLGGDATALDADEGGRQT